MTYLEPSSEFQKHTENLSPPVYLCVSVSPCLYSCLCQCSGGQVHCHAIKATGILHVTSLISDKFQQSPVPICIENKIDIARIANAVQVTILNVMIQVSQFVINKKCLCSYCSYSSHCSHWTHRSKSANFGKNVSVTTTN